MKKAVIAASVAAAVAATALAQTINTPADAFKAGQDFSNSNKGKGAAAGSVNTNSGTTNVPKYNTSPPETSIYGGGKSLIGAQGTNKIATCASYTASNAYDQQECNAVNYLQQMPAERPKFVIDKNTDPLMVNSKGTIANPGTIPASGTAACHIEKTTIPGTYTTETCEMSTVLDSFECKKTLIPECGYVGTAISTHNETKTGAFVYATFEGTGTAGLYNYNLEVPYRNCGGDGVGEVTFNLDTIGFGSYITINLSNLDDAAAVGVNGTTVFAGYPNAGPQYSGGFFPTERKDFQVGYSWIEDVGKNQCVELDGDGNCTKTAWVPNVQSFYANTKLLDYCPSGYSPTSQLAYQYCDSDTGYCNPLNSYTPNNVAGFFCNSEGKFLMNKHEGGGTWAGSVSSAMPLQTGANKITVYWGTGAWGDACGNVKVSGQIYNVAPGCTNKFDDQCAAARGALKN
ncbi:hypothetical protein [Ideonella sp. B508-1]|uniref:hypothetical protein n=1 Tax=Ideonella sp. B508-1 TaxID=137716 RepID=UPI000347CBFC|nr:hypothetical protein [Ideonella sp. B508-1]